MSRKRAKFTDVSPSEIEAVTKTISFDISQPKPVKVLRWQDNNNNQHTIYLFSDNYPNLPSARINSLENRGPRQNIISAIENQVSQSTYWYNHFQQLQPLIEDVSAALQVYAIKNASTYNNIARKVKAIPVFFELILSETDIVLPKKLSEISLRLLKKFRIHLYKYHRKDRLSKGLTNKESWTNGIPGLISYFTKRHGFDFVHDSIRQQAFPKFSDGNDEKTKTIPYNDLEMYQIIQCCDETCSNYMSNWKIMRDIENQKIGNWNNIDDVCWSIVNIEWQIENKGLQASGREHDKYLKKFASSRKHFFEKYSVEDIRAMADRGSCPYTQFMLVTFNSLTPAGKCIFARSWIRMQLAPFFDARSSLLAGSVPDWTSVIKAALRLVYFKTSSRASEKYLAFWEAAELKPVSSKGQAGFTSLFFPTGESLYPFHLFTMATAGENKSVIDTLQRDTLLSGLFPNEKVYVGHKPRANRDVEVVTSDEEANGIFERIEFIKEITKPLIAYLPKKMQEYSLWTGLRIETAQIVSFADRDIRQAWEICAKNFCQQNGLRQVSYDNNGGLYNITPLLAIDSKRIRKTCTFKDIADDIPYHVLQAALSDKSFDVVFHYYINSKTQRRINFKAIAALQEVLFSEMKAYNRSTLFAGEIVYDMSLSNAEDISLLTANACVDPHHCFAGDNNIANACNAGFDLCLGCKNSRVFREHLPAICFRILQFEQKKLRIYEADWEMSFGLYYRRANNCLDQYGSRGTVYNNHVVNAWLIAKSENSVFMPPLV